MALLKPLHNHFWQNALPFCDKSVTQKCHTWLTDSVKAQSLPKSQSPYN